MKDLDRRIRQGGDDAIAAVSELVPRWIPVSERLPDGRQEVLGWQTWLPDEGWGEGVFVCHRGTKVGEWYSQEGQLPNITHWMPLPEPPPQARDILREQWDEMHKDTAR